MTIPTLIQNTQEQELKVAWKEIYSQISQAQKMIAADYGGNIANVFTDNLAYFNNFKTYLIHTKECLGTDYGDVGVYTGGCWHSANNWWYKTGAAITSDSSPQIRNGLILNNGALIRTHINSLDCSATSYTTNNFNDAYCGNITVDVNGFKKPNIVGRDIFQVFVTSNSLVPWGGKPYSAPESNINSACIASDALGWGCSAAYLLNN